MKILNWLFDKEEKEKMKVFKEESTEISYTVKLDMYMSVLYFALYGKFRCYFYLRDYSTENIIENYTFKTRQFHIPKTFGASSKKYIIESVDNIIAGEIGHNTYIDLKGNHSGSKDEVMYLCVNNEMLYSIFKDRSDLKERVCSIILSELKDDILDDRPQHDDDIFENKNKKIESIKKSLFLRDEEIMLFCLQKLLKEPEIKRN